MLNYPWSSQNRRKGTHLRCMYVWGLLFIPGISWRSSRKNSTLGGIMTTGRRREVEFHFLSYTTFSSWGTLAQNAAPDCESVEPRNEHEPFCGSAGGPLISLEEIWVRDPSRWQSRILLSPELDGGTRGPCLGLRVSFDGTLINRDRRQWDQVPHPHHTPGVLLS